MMSGMADPILTARIRAIFLHHEPRVTIGDAARMLGWTRTKLNTAIRNGDVEVLTTRNRKMIDLDELELQALQLWSLNTIEDALGPDADRIMPPALRTQSFTIRVPRYQIAALEVLAETGHESVDTMVVRMFEELADLHRERLSAHIPGLTDAIAWPKREATEALPRDP
jgi:hypothetical protein